MGTAAPAPQDVRHDQFNVRWKNYTNVLHAVFRELLEEERLCDVTLSCEGGSVKCHRMILTACSVYFEKLIAQYPLEHHLVIFMKDLKHWELQALVHFMYNGEVSVKQNRLAPLVRAAESLRIRGLSSEGSPEGMSNPVNVKEEEGEGDEADGSQGQQGQEPRTSQQKQQQMKRNIPQQSAQRRNIPQTHPKSLLRQTTNAHPRMVVQKGQNNQNQNQRISPQQHQQSGVKRPSMTMTNGPPKLIKMQKIDEPSTNTNSGIGTIGNGSLAKTVPPKINVETPNVTIEEVEEEGNEPEEEEYELEYLQPGKNGNNGTANNGYVDGRRSSASDEMELDENGQGQGAEKRAYKYDQATKTQALEALGAGLTLREVSDAFGVPRKTLSKWRCREASISIAELNENVNEEAIPTGGAIEEEETHRTEPVENHYPVSLSLPEITDPPMTGPVVDANDRAERLKKATDLALGGITVRQAAAHYGIPRTTLCAYMKRRGLTGKRANLNTSPQAGAGAGIGGTRKIAINRNRLSANSNDGNGVGNNPSGSSSRYNKNQSDGFLFGLSDLVDELQGYEEDDGEGEGEGMEQEYEEDYQNQDVDADAENQG